MKLIELSWTDGKNRLRRVSCLFEKGFYPDESEAYKRVFETFLYENKSKRFRELPKFNLKTVEL